MTAREASGIRVLLADRQQLLCEAVGPLLESAVGLGKITWTTKLDGALEEVRQMTSGVVLFDPGLGDNRPLAAAEGMLEASPAVRVVFLDDRVRPLHLRVAADLQVTGYWTKHASVAELAAATRTAAAGRATFSPLVRSSVLFTPRGWELNRAAPHNRLASLTNREMEVMLCLARGQSVKQCAEDLDVAESTVDNHKARLMKKLDIHKVTALSLLAIQEGLLV
jgi:DNA-binding NarL/FixJ family response regulator